MSGFFKNALSRLLPGGRRAAGRDLAGNTYYEWPNPMGGRTKRSVEYRVKMDIADYTAGERLPVQWTSWLSHTRATAPTLEELQADAERRRRLVHSVAEIEARDAAEREQRRLLSAPTASTTVTPHQAQNSTGSSAYHQVSATAEEQQPSEGSERSAPADTTTEESREKDPNAPVDVDLRRLAQQQTELARRRLEMSKSPLDGYAPIDPKEADRAGRVEGDVLKGNEGAVPTPAPRMRPRPRGAAAAASTTSSETKPESSVESPAATASSSDQSSTPILPDAWSSTRARRLQGKPIKTELRNPFERPKREFSSMASFVDRRRGIATQVAQEQAPVAYRFLREPLPYDVGLRLQDRIVQHRLAARARDPESLEAKQDVMLLLEHRPTYTTGRRDASLSGSVHPEEAKIQNAGAEFAITKRGGQVTYHGPGQLVGYPILDLGKMGLSTRCYVDYVQKALATYTRSKISRDVLAPHPDGHVGIFLTPQTKISSIGIQIRHRITSHGFSLNVTREPLAWFDLVLACGLADVRAVSLETAMDAGSSLDVEQTAMELMPFFADKFRREFVALEDDASQKYLVDAIGEAEEEAKIHNSREPLPVAPRT